MTREVGFLGATELVRTPVFDRDLFGPKVRISGPAVIEQYESTTVLPSGWDTLVDELGNLVLKRN